MHPAARIARSTPGAVTPAAHRSGSSRPGARGATGAVRRRELKEGAGDGRTGAAGQHPGGIGTGQQSGLFGQRLTGDLEDAADTGAGDVAGQPGQVDDQVGEVAGRLQGRVRGPRCQSRQRWTGCPSRTPRLPGERQAGARRAAGADREAVAVVEDRSGPEPAYWPHGRRPRRSSRSPTSGAPGGSTRARSRRRATVDVVRTVPMSTRTGLAPPGASVSRTTDHRRSPQWPAVPIDRACGRRRSSSCSHPARSSTRPAGCQPHWERRILRRGDGSAVCGVHASRERVGEPGGGGGLERHGVTVAVGDRRRRLCASSATNPARASPRTRPSVLTSKIRAAMATAS